MKYKREIITQQLWQCGSTCRHFMAFYPTPQDIPEEPLCYCWKAGKVLGFQTRNGSLYGCGIVVNVPGFPLWCPLEDVDEP